MVKFFVLTFALTWSCFTTMAILARSAPPGAPGYALLLLGTFAPSIVAISFTWRAEGMAGVTSLLGRMLRWQAGATSYIFALALFPAIKLAVALTYRVIAGEWPRLGNESPAIIVIAIVLSTPFQAGEEVGWRGYALPRMAARLGFGPASIVLGVLWGLWHLPLFFVPGEYYGQPFFVFALGITALSVAIAWLYARTNGSLLLTMLMHSAVNQTVGIVPDARAHPGNPFSLRAPIPFYLTAGFLWVAAGYLLVRFRWVGAPRVQKAAA
jgi:membrane protease YdiL (CAAX protease family)